MIKHNNSNSNNSNNGNNANKCSNNNDNLDNMIIFIYKYIIVYILILKMIGRKERKPLITSPQTNKLSR